MIGRDFKPPSILSAIPVQWGGLAKTKIAGQAEEFFGLQKPLSNEDGGRFFKQAARFSTTPEQWIDAIACYPSPQHPDACDDWNNILKPKPEPKPEPEPKPTSLNERNSQSDTTLDEACNMAHGALNCFKHIGTQLIIANRYDDADGVCRAHPREPRPGEGPEFREDKHPPRPDADYQRSREKEERARDQSHEDELNDPSAAPIEAY